jgi:hypothetical protein
MAEEVKEQSPPADAPPPKAPRRLKLAVRSDGTPGGTHLVDAETGEAIAFEAYCHADVEGHPKKGGTAVIRLVFHDIEVDAAQAESPFQLLGATLGHAPPPSGTAFGAAGGPFREVPVTQPTTAGNLNRRLSESFRPGGV